MLLPRHVPLEARARGDVELLDPCRWVSERYVVVPGAEGSEAAGKPVSAESFKVVSVEDDVFEEHGSDQTIECLA